ncbi:MAG TPA: nuclear transport factor 2 family protein [Acidimicrobiia bacterium]|jgi:ketosteroid isomerase-like protein
MSRVEVETRRVVEELYRAYLAGDPEGMLATMSDDVHVRFLGRVDFTGIEEARRFFHANTSRLLDLDFRIAKLIVDGHHAAGVWSETATTPDGRPYANHGVDVFEVRDGKVVSVHENNDITVVRRHFG